MSALLRFIDIACWRGERLLFEGLSFQLQPGEALVVEGPNGIGKSSLLRMAAGLLRPLSGSIERGSVALSDERCALDPELPLSRALRFWSDASHADRALAATGLADLAEVPVRLLSTGQRRRASLARVHASGASLWLLDEPANGLDSRSLDRLGTMIAGHRADGGAVLAASHQPLPGGEWRSLALPS